MAASHDIDDIEDKACGLFFLCGARTFIDGGAIFHHADAHGVERRTEAPQRGADGVPEGWRTRWAGGPRESCALHWSNRHGSCSGGQLAGQRQCAKESGQKNRQVKEAVRGRGDPRSCAFCQNTWSEYLFVFAQNDQKVTLEYH